METKCWWTVDPASTQWIPKPTFLPRDHAADHIRHARQTSDATDVWIFTDGSVIRDHPVYYKCGAAALFYSGNGPVTNIHSVRFTGLHSSTQAELIAIREGCQHLNTPSPHSCITIVSDSQTALASLENTQDPSELSITTREILSLLRYRTRELRLWWTPGHIELSENDAADQVAHQAAMSLCTSHALGPDQANDDDSPLPPIIDVPYSAVCLRTLIRHHYISNINTQWDIAHPDHDLDLSAPNFTPSILWTHNLTRHESVLAAQFLSGHYLCPHYLYVLGLTHTQSCPWCDYDICDRTHILFHCPRFAYERQRHAHYVADSSVAAYDRSIGWTWHFLATGGRHFLASFLRAIHRVVMNALSSLGTDSSS